ncbi:MAG: hypothetical protein NVS9B15_10910 [Acidobacteriaceae bacterium]
MSDFEALTARLVVHRADKIIKGDLESNGLRNIGEILRRGSAALPETLWLRDSQSGERVEVPLKGAKALFFVREFGGQKDRKDLHFHQKSAVHDGVWGRLGFHDGEELEGLIFNSIEALAEPGFLCCRPTPAATIV